MLTDAQIAENRERFISLFKSLNREGSDIDGLLKELDESDFYFAPATIQSHGSYAGGLCEHSLNVYDTLLKLVDSFASERVLIEEDVEQEFGYKDIYVNKPKFTVDTLKIVGLLASTSKINFYEEYSKNVKQPDGKWAEVKCYKVRNPEDRTLLGGKAFNSFMFISKYIPLSEMEIATIVNQYAGMDKTENTEDIYHILGRYSLITLLHSADMISSYILGVNK